jgi:hypothetical protein
MAANLTGGGSFRRPHLSGFADFYFAAAVEQELDYPSPGRIPKGFAHGGNLFVVHTNTLPHISRNIEVILGRVNNCLNADFVAGLHIAHQTTDGTAEV